MASTPDELLSIGEMAARSGVAPSALRFYEERALIASERTPAGHRRFPRHVLRRVAFIVFAQRVGLSLDEIGAELHRLPADRTPSGADWATLSGRWIERVDDRIRELKTLRHDLSSCIGCGCLSLESCSMINPGDEAARLGPGPARWVDPELGDARG
jgi:MerR family transcriptional regulator, redox-sensitive transcriptional activator SoxR